MVKGVSKQVIVVHAPEPKLFEQAIFILSEPAVRKGVTDEELLREAKALIRHSGKDASGGALLRGPAWACGGAGLMGLLWILCSFL